MPLIREENVLQKILSAGQTIFKIMYAKRMRNIFISFLKTII